MNNEIEAFIEKKFLNIFVVGVGKGGVSAINMIHDKRGSGIEYLICDTDEMLLNKSQVKHKIHIKEKNTLSEHNKKQIKEYTEKAKVFVISALFYENQVYFKPQGKWFVNELKKKCRLDFSSNRKVSFFSSKSRFNQRFGFWRYSF